MNIFGKSENAKIKELESKISTLVRTRDAREEEHEKEVRDLRNSNYKEVSNLKEDNKIILARKDAEVDVIISKAKAEQTKEIAKLTLENGTYKKEVEILTTAFKNLGFDVKDMKDILNKLVDGIVGKNIIQLVK